MSAEFGLWLRIEAKWANVDLAGKKFWDGFWQHQSGRSFGRLSYFHRAFSQVLFRYAHADAAACEIGCGASVWLPLLALNGVRAWGVDYSDVGLTLLRQHLDRDGTNATIVLGDVFDDTGLPRAFFDVVFSLGLVEHFDDPQRLIQRLRDLCRPGGIVITIVPNFQGFWGGIQRWIDPPFYDVHQLYAATRLDAVHLSSGLEAVEPARYFGGVGPLVVNYSGLLQRLPPPVARGVLGALWILHQGASWCAAALVPGLARSGRFSTHVLGVYRNPVDGGSTPRTLRRSASQEPTSPMDAGG